MEISFDLGAIPSFNSSHCARLDNEQLKSLNVRKFPVLSAFIDKMGKLSADAQKLQRVLTSYSKIVEDPHQVLYVLWEPGHKANQSFVIGFLKIGRRNLYLYDDQMQSYQDMPICLLDFYVHYGLQRKGYGKILFDVMLKEENIVPHMIAIDKPSDNLLFFLKKHYGLTSPCWQSTNYVVYPQFFEVKRSIANGKTSAIQYNLASPLKPLINDDSSASGVRSLLGSLRISPTGAKGGGDVGDFPLPSPKTPLIGVQENQRVSPLLERSPSNGGFVSSPAATVSSTPLSTNGSLPDAQPFLLTTGHQPVEMTTTVTSSVSTMVTSGHSVVNSSGHSTLTAASAAATTTSSNTLAKERKLMSMGHHKLW